MQTPEELLLAIQFRRWTHPWFELNKSGLRGRASRAVARTRLPVRCVTAENSGCCAGATHAVIASMATTFTN
jgi:hypothetical protein